MKYLNLFILLFVSLLLVSCTKEEEKTNPNLVGLWSGSYSGGFSGATYTFHFLNNTEYNWIVDTWVDYIPGGCADTTEYITGTYEYGNDSLSLEGQYTLMDFSTTVTSCYGRDSSQTVFGVEVVTPDTILLKLDANSPLTDVRLGRM